MKINTKYKEFEVMKPGEKLVHHVLVILGLILTTIFGIWWFEPQHIPGNFTGLPHALDILAFLLLSYVVWYQITYELFSWYLSSGMKVAETPLVPEKGLKVALLTAFVPNKEPYDVLERAFQAMIAVEYKHDTWVLDEGDDPITKKLCKKYGVKHYSRKGREDRNTPEGKYKARTKAGNYNSWFTDHASEYDIVAQHDVDFVPHKDFFNATLGYFRDPKIAFVGTPQIYGNKSESWIACGAAEQAYGFYGPIQKGLHAHHMSLFIGANHLVRVSAHDDIEGYSGHIVEDHLTGMKFYAKRWKSVYVPKILAVGEGPATWDSYFSQQMRWAYGLMDILFKHSPNIFQKMRKRHILNYFLLQQYYFYGVAQVIGIALMTLYFTFGFQSTSMEIAPLFYIYLPLLILQLIVFFWLQRFNVDPKEERGFLWRGRLLSLAAWPIYFTAFLGVMMGRKLTYAITPKGGAQTTETHPSLFLPHFLLGTVSFFGIIAAIFTGHTAPQILFWAVINTIVMYGFCIAILLQPVYISWLKRAFVRTSPYFAATAAAAALLFFGSHASTVNYYHPVESMQTAISEPLETAAEKQVYKIHSVKNGESLRRIAAEYYGDETTWSKIEINRKPDLIYPGDIALIPE